MVKKASKAGAGPASSKDAAPRGRKMSAKQKAMVKLRDNYRGMTEFETEIKVDSVTKKTLIEQLEADILKEESGQKVVWGANYHQALKRIFFKSLLF